VQFVPKDGTGAPYTLIGGTAAGADALTIAFTYMTGPDYDNTAAAWLAGSNYVTGKTKTVSSTSVTPTTFWDAGSSSYIVSLGTPTVPAGSGVGTIAIYGSKLVIVPTLAGNNLHRTAAQHITKAFATTTLYYFDLTTGAQVTDPALQRRDVVATSKCNACHTAINIHSRNETQLCVMCHAPNLYLKAGTQSGVPYPDYSGNLKDMIHNIHGGMTSTISFRAVGVVYSEMPNSTRNCTICHISAATAGLPLPTGVVASSLQSGSTNTSMTGGPTPPKLPIKAACTSCHETAATAAHADLTTDAGVETCEVCHSSTSFLGNAHAPVK